MARLIVAAVLGALLWASGAVASDAVTSDARVAVEAFLSRFSDAKITSLVIEQTLRRTHRLQDAAAAALVVATSVQDVAHRSHLDLPDDDVTRVARAAAQLARGLVAGDGPGMLDALHCLARGWHRLACCAELAA